MKFNIGTRSSRLAMLQTDFISDGLRQKGHQTAVVTFDTIGDRNLGIPIGKIGGKGVFTEELEIALKRGVIDLAVHSAKDLPTDIESQFEIVSFTKREASNDVLVSNKQININGNSMVIGTSSARRTAFLKHFYPGHAVVDIRGNIQTRFKKMNSGKCDALMLANAGISRMGLDRFIKHRFITDLVVPPVGQGSLAIEVSSALSNEKKNILRKSLNHLFSEQLIIAERSFLKTLQGGCSIPAFGLAEWHEKKIYIKGGIISLDGKKMVKKELFGYDSIELGAKLAEQVLNAGGSDILSDIRKTL